MEKKIKKLQSIIDKLYAMELLEYHDKKYLSGDNKSRSEEKQIWLVECNNLLRGICNV